MNDKYAEFSGCLTADVLSFKPDAIPAPDTLVIRMTRGERRIADEIRKEFGGFKRVVIDVDGEQHEFPADIMIGLLEGYEDVHRVNRHMALFGTPERAARTLALMCQGTKTCATCPLFGAGLNHCKNDYTDFASIAKWLRGEDA